MTDDKEVIRIAGLALVRERRILLVRKRGLSTLILPGGKIEEDEVVFKALQRELYEELGTQLGRQQVSHVGIFTGPAAGQEDTAEVRVDLYTGFLESEPVASGEIEELVWVDLDDYEGLDLAPSLRLKILPYVAGTLPLQSGLPWRPRASDCRACGQTLSFNCRDCHPGEEDFCDREGCASGRAIHGHNVPLIATDAPDVHGGRRVSGLLGTLEDRIAGPGYVLVSGADYAALVARASPGPSVTLEVQPDDKLYEVHTMADGRRTFRGSMTAAEAVGLGPAGPVEAPEDVEVGLTRPLRRRWSSGPTPSVQAVPRTAPHLARIFDRSEVELVTRVAYDGTDVSHLPADQQPWSRQLYAGNVPPPGDTGDSPGRVGAAGDHAAPVPAGAEPAGDNLEEPARDVWFWPVVALLAAGALLLLWHYVAEPLIFT